MEGKVHRSCSFHIPKSPVFNCPNRVRVCRTFVLQRVVSVPLADQRRESIFFVVNLTGPQPFSGPHRLGVPVGPHPALRRHQHQLLKQTMHSWEPRDVLIGADHVAGAQTIPKANPRGVFSAGVELPLTTLLQEVARIVAQRLRIVDVPSGLPSTFPEAPHVKPYNFKAIILVWRHYRCVLLKIVAVRMREVNSCFRLQVLFGLRVPRGLEINPIVAFDSNKVGYWFGGSGNASGCSIDHV